MAVQVDDIALEEEHFSGPEFDQLLEQNGTSILLRMATPCGCWNPTTGNPDPACQLCVPFGVVYDAPVQLKVFGPNRKGLRQFLDGGTIEMGDALFTFPLDVTPTQMSRITLLTSTLPAPAFQIKGREDVLRYTEVLAVERAHYSVRTPPTGHPYTRENVPLVEGTDFTRAGRVITWLNTTIPDGTPYVLRVRIRTEYVVSEATLRDENDTQLQTRVLAKRLDYLINPRGEAKLSY